MVIGLPGAALHGKSLRWAAEMNGRDAAAHAHPWGARAVCWTRPAVASLSLVLTPAAGETV